MKNFKLFSPTDYRYGVNELIDYLTEESFIKYKIKVEISLLETLYDFKICPKYVVDEVKNASKKIKAEEIYREEKRIKHDIRALVNVLKKYVSEKSKPFIHLAATSYDIVDTARSLMLKEATEKVIIPDMIELEKIFIKLARKEKNTLQIGRTHGQHAEPITFGFFISLYVERWGERILKVKETKDNLKGKFSGAVGCYNGLRLIVKEVEKFEKKLTEKLNLTPSRISTQILLPEPMVDFTHSIISSFSVLANFSDDMRHLQRTEIGEVGEPFEKKQVGSSTMPQKRNPINFENVKSGWKTFMPRIITSYMDQISEHQRDLTNSLSQRYIPEILVIFDSSVRRIKKITENITVDRKNLKRNFDISRDKVIAEPLQILLSYYGHPEAHEKVRKLAMKSYQENIPLTEIIFQDEEIKKYLKKFTHHQIEIIKNPEKYTGIADKKVEKICNLWEKKMKEIQNGKC